MTLNRITSMLGAVALGGVLVASTYGAQAARPSTAPAHSGHVTHLQHLTHAQVVKLAGDFQPPMLHKYGKNGLRLGYHCETKDMGPEQ
jgi:hypothetical protein